MRASPLFRLSALWALLVFAFGWGGDALVLHPCPHHSAIAHAAPAAHEGHGGGGHHAAASPEAQDPHDAPSHAGGCSCIVACAGSADALAAAPADVRIAAGAVRIARIVPAPHASVLPGRSEHLLPYPTAPPVLPA